MIIENEWNPDIKDILLQRQLKRRIQQGIGRMSPSTSLLITYMGGEADDIEPIEDPEIKKLLPELTKEEYQSLKESIKSEGQHEPIIVDKDYKIIDGYHRYQVSNELGNDPTKIKALIIPCKNQEERIQLATGLNVKRRQMNHYLKMVQELHHQVS